jgi:sirohydrochlorin cobaltochelatase
MAHGSKNASWLRPFQQLAFNLKKDVGEDRVHLCFMELASPSLEEMAEQLDQAGVSHVQLLPLFLASGSHLCHDVPDQLAALRIKFPRLLIEQLPPIGENEKFAEMLRALVGQYIAPGDASA